MCVFACAGRKDRQGHKSVGQSTSHSLLLIGNTNTGVQQYELMVTFTADPLFDLPLSSTQTMERSCLSHFGT